MTTVFPCLRYRDARAAITWLVKAFGLSEDRVVVGEHDRVEHAVLGWRGGGIILSSATEGAIELATPPGAAGVYLVTEDPDALHDRAVAAGAEIVYPLTDQPYGSRDFTAVDPEGNRWNFGTYRPTAT